MHAGEAALLQRQLDDRDATIRDLRARLDASEAERRQNADRLAAAHERITALLAGSPVKPASLADSPPRTRWQRFLAWRRWP
jgi:hypothetical protein